MDFEWSQEELDTLLVKFPAASSFTDLTKAFEVMEATKVLHTSEKNRRQLFRRMIAKNLGGSRQKNNTKYK